MAADNECNIISVFAFVLVQFLGVLTVQLDQQKSRDATTYLNMLTQWIAWDGRFSLSSFVVSLEKIVFHIYEENTLKNIWWDN